MIGDTTVLFAETAVEDGGLLEERLGAVDNSTELVISPVEAEELGCHPYPPPP